jgi:hypothetical protein
VSETLPAQLDFGDVIAVLVASAMGAGVAYVWVDPVTGRWWVPALAGLIAGLAVALLVPGSKTPVGMVPTLASPRVTTAPLPPPVVVVDPDATAIRPRRSTASLTTFAVRTITLPKLGGSDGENEDAFAISPDGTRIAVADGASSAYASRQWSRLLADSFANFEFEVSEQRSRESFISGCAGRWSGLVAEDGNWWNNEARSRGSFAAFIGVAISPDLSVRADAVGDCCMFVLDADHALVQAFPVERSSDFDSTPSLLATASPENGEWLNHSNHIRDGRSLVVASDAVAAWLLASAPTRFGWLLSHEIADWKQVFDLERESRAMVNDDVTVVVVTAPRRTA